MCCKPHSSIRTLVVFLFLAALAFASATPAWSQADAQAGTPARIRQAVDESSLITLTGNTHPLAKASFDRGPAPESMPASRLLLVLRRSAEQEAALDTFLQSVQNPEAPTFHQWLTPEQFGRRFGVSAADLATVQGWLRSHGFTVDRVAAGGMAIEFSGSAGQIKSAFHTELHRYVVDGKRHWANASDPRIPSALAPVVAGLAQIGDFVPRAQFVRAPSGVYNPETGRIEPTYTLGNTTQGYTMFVGPADAAAIYDIPNKLNPQLTGTVYDGTGFTIGIAGDSNIDVAQNANYRATFGLPVNPTQVVVDGFDPGENGDEIEAYLDTQVAGGIAPGASVILYTAANTPVEAGLWLAVTRALDENQVDILNVSFGSCERSQGVAGNLFIQQLWQQAAAQGISVTVSSGDSGSAGCDNPDTEWQAKSGLAVNAIASTPWNIAVGGTDFDVLFSSFPTSFTQYVDTTNTLPHHRSAKGYIPEKPWNDSTFQGYNTTISANVPWSATQYFSNANIVAGGGGVSACTGQQSGHCTAGYAVPAWQLGIGADLSGRNVPDVSLLAGNGLYGATWGICTDLEYSTVTGDKVKDCAGTPATGNHFNLTGVGGTSAAAPAFAGILALVDQKVGGRVGQADYVLYKLKASGTNSSFNPISDGNNSVSCNTGASGCAKNASGYYFMTGFNAIPGYNEAIGLGSVNATRLLNAWSSAGLASTTTRLALSGKTAGPLHFVHGAKVEIGAAVTGHGGQPAGSVALVDSLQPATQPNSGSVGSFPLTADHAAPRKEFRADFCALLHGEEQAAEPLARPVA